MRTAVAAALLLTVGTLAAAGCGRADSSEPVSFSDIDSVIAAADDQDEEAVVVATAYDDDEDRDGAARRFEGQVRPPAQGAVWTLGLFTVRVSGNRDPETVDALTEALEDRGAE